MREEEEIYEDLTDLKLGLSTVDLDDDIQLGYKYVKDSAGRCIWALKDQVHCRKLKF